MKAIAGTVRASPRRRDESEYAAIKPTIIQQLTVANQHPHCCLRKKLRTEAKATEPSKDFQCFSISERTSHSDGNEIIFEVAPTHDYQFSPTVLTLLSMESIAGSMNTKKNTSTETNATLWDSGASISIIGKSTSQAVTENFEWGPEKETTIQGFNKAAKLLIQEGTCRQTGASALRVRGSIKNVISAGRIAKQYHDQGMVQSMFYDEDSKTVQVRAEFGNEAVERAKQGTLIAQSAPNSFVPRATLEGSRLLTGRPTFAAVGHDSSIDSPGHGIHAAERIRRGNERSSSLSSSESTNIPGLKALVLKCGGYPHRVKTMLKRDTALAKRLHIYPEMMTEIAESYPDSAKIISTMANRQSRRMRCDPVPTAPGVAYVYDEISLGVKSMGLSTCNYRKAPTRAFLFIVDLFSGAGFAHFYTEQTEIPAIIHAFICKRNHEFALKGQAAESTCKMLYYDDATVHSSKEMKQILRKLGVQAYAQPKGSHRYTHYLDSMVHQVKRQAQHLLTAQMIPAKLFPYAIQRAIETNNLLLPYAASAAHEEMPPVQRETGTVFTLSSLPFLFGSPALVKKETRKITGQQAIWAQYLGTGEGGESYFHNPASTASRVLVRKTAIIFEQVMTAQAYHCMVNNLPMDDTDLTSHRRTLTRAMTDRKYGIGTFQDVKGKRPYQMIQHQTVVRFKCLGTGTGKKGKRKKCNSHFNSIHELRKHWESTTCKHDTTNSTGASPEDHGNHADNILDTFTGVIALNDILPETLLSRTVIIQTSELPPGTTIVLSSPTTPRKGTKDLISSIAADISESLTSWSSMSHTLYDARTKKKCKRVPVVRLMAPTWDITTVYWILWRALSGVSRRTKIRLTTTPLHIVFPQDTDPDDIQSFQLKLKSTSDGVSRSIEGVKETSSETVSRRKSKRLQKRQQAPRQSISCIQLEPSQTDIHHLFQTLIVDGETKSSERRDDMDASSNMMEWKGNSDKEAILKSLQAYERICIPAVKGTRKDRNRCTKSYKQSTQLTQRRMNSRTILRSLQNQKS